MSGRNQSHQIRGGEGCRLWLPPPEDAQTRRDRHRMVEEQLLCAGRGVKDRRVIDAMSAVPRHLFVPGHSRDEAYEDHPLPIGFGQTISQPYIVACMTEFLDLRPHERILEVGTGCGYQTAVLSLLACEVCSIEIIPELAAMARDILDSIQITNVQIRTGDGFSGWPEKAPFDAILVACSPEAIPPPLTDQLREGGRMVIPVGPSFHQELRLLEKHDGSIHEKRLMAVRFVPMTGRAER